MQTVTHQRRIAAAVRALRAKLDQHATSASDMEWGFPNGHREHYKTYTLQAPSGLVQVGLPRRRWGTRVPHLLRLVKEQGPPSPDVELNIPNKLDRRVSGLYAQAGDDIWLCTRGSFTAFRGRIPIKLARAHFSKWLRDIDDEGQRASVIPVVSLSSPSFATDLATFVQGVVELKSQYKQGALTLPQASGDSEDWSRGKEFEGRKTGHRASSTTIDYEYLHGPICNRLEDYLRRHIAKAKKFGRNSQVDAAVIDRKTKLATTIFEVKTAAFPSHQIYSAVGQLLYYRHRYGQPTTRLFVVLPNAVRSEHTASFLSELEIELIYEDGGTFLTASGAALRDRLQ